MISIPQDIIDSMAKKKPGEVVFPTDFRGLATESAINKALSRLRHEGLLKRLARGIYYIPRYHPQFGELRPGSDEIAKRLAEREGTRIRLASAYALNALGLCTQVPMRVVYITDGASRQVKIGKLVIRFVKASSKKLATKGKISALVIQALEALELDHMDKYKSNRIRELLLKEDPELLRHDLSMTTGKVNDYVVRLLGPF